MGLKGIDGGASKGAPQSDYQGRIGHYLASAAKGNVDAYFDLGVAFSTGSHGAVCDLVEAHKWFNLAAAMGHEEAAHCRADISEEMSAREIAEAQRNARAWLSSSRKVA